MLGQRIKTAIILVLVFLAALFVLPSIFWGLLIGAMIAAGAWEWAKLSRLESAGATVYSVLLVIAYLALMVMFFLFHPVQKHLLQLLVYGIAAFFWLIVVPLWFIKGWRVESVWLLSLIGAVVLLPTGLAMLDLRALSPWWLLAVMGLVWMADIAAYFAGRQFGKHKLAPSISPGKTWEGVIGALAGVLVYAVVILSQKHMLGRYGLLILAMFAVAISVMGDLFESLIKRQAGVKDSGNMLPGHGGLLDRIDALTSTLPLAALILITMKAA